MLRPSLQDVLKQITISAYGKVCEGNDDIAKFVYATGFASDVRESYEAVQFESNYQTLVDGKDGWFVCTEFSLSSGLLWYCATNEIDLKNIKWRHLMPNPHQLDSADKPKTATDWINLGWVVVDHWIAPDSLQDEDDSDAAKFEQLVEDHLAVTLSDAIDRINKKKNGV